MTTEKKLDIMLYLLARIVADQNNKEPMDVILEAGEFWKAVEERKPRAKRTPPVDQAAVDRIYALYPPKCPISGRATGKGQKDKEKIGRLLANIPEEKLAATINQYLQDCLNGKSYIKNFSTFLNNIPEYSEPASKKSEGVNAYDLVGDW